MPSCSTEKRSVLTALGFALLFASGTTWADLVSPQVQSAWKRYEQNPKAFDQADQYCVAKKPGAACVIPGSAFEGGGAGICERAVSQGSQYISLNCNRGERIQIDRQIPDGPFRVDSSLCPDAERNPAHTCSEPALLSDRFCAGGKAGQACMAELSIDGKTSSHAGVCRISVETTRFYFRGRHEGQRPVLACEPASRAPERVYTPVGAWEKFLQW